MDINWREREKAKARMRRHHRYRLMKKRKNYWFGPLINNPDRFSVWSRITYTENDELKRLNRLVDTPHPCSRHCCGNPRKWFGELTLQEKKAEILFEEDYDWWWELPYDLDLFVEEMEHPENFGPPCWHQIEWEKWQKKNKSA